MALQRDSSVLRRKIKYNHANLLFDTWLKEWQDLAKDSNMKYHCAKARKSLSLFPLPVYSGTDCKVLQYFGNKICKMIDRRISQYEQQSGPINWDDYIKVVEGRPKTPRSGKKRRRSLDQLCSRSIRSTRSAEKTSDVTDIVATTSNSVFAPETIENVHSKPSRRSRKKKQDPSQAEKTESLQTKSPPLSSASCSSTANDREACDEMDTDCAISDALYVLPAGTFDVVLCVDCAETTHKNSKEGIVKQLQQHGVNFEVRKLHVGDFAWIAREKMPINSKKVKELVLPYIVERKRMDDLASSIKDGRCREQKHRLLQCGISTAIYLVEMTGYQRTGLPLSTCMQAVANTAVVDGLQVKWTQDFRETAAFLTLVTRILQETYQGRSLTATKRSSRPLAPGCTELPEFAAFNIAAMKNRQLSVREMLAKHLLQLSGLSVAKVAAIVNEAPTPRALVALVSSEEGVRKLGSLQPLRGGRAVGHVASSSIAALYTRRHLH